MIFINNEEKITEFKTLNNYYVITDFDRTLTTKDSEPSYGIIPKFLGGECLEKRTKIYNHYRPIELDYTLEKTEKQKIMRQWAKESFTLLSKFTTEDIIDKSLENANIYLRDGAREFLYDMYKNNIPVVIMSAGIGNVIKRFLEIQNVLYSNIILVANFFDFKDGEAYIDINNVIATSNKTYEKIPVQLRNKLQKIDKCLLFGDIIEDIEMCNKDNIEKTLTVGFLDKNIDENMKVFNKNYDVVLCNNESFCTIQNVLNN